MIIINFSYFIVLIYFLQNVIFLYLLKESMGSSIRQFFTCLKYLLTLC